MHTKFASTSRIRQGALWLRFVAPIVLVGLITGGCPLLCYNPVIDPANFVAGITNQYLPLTPGVTRIYTGNKPDGVEVNRVTVTSDTKSILGVVCMVVHDTVTLDGNLIEDTLDWFAQDTEGNVWYFGEDSKEIENDVVVSTEGSWEAGVDGAKPGIVMLANPTVGAVYRQEFLQGVAEDMGKVVALDENVTVPFGAYANCLKTKDFTPLDRSVVEFKYYAPGVGLVLTEEDDANVELTGIENR